MCLVRRAAARERPAMPAPIIAMRIFLGSCSCSRSLGGWIWDWDWVWMVGDGMVSDLDPILEVEEEEGWSWGRKE